MNYTEAPIIGILSQETFSVQNVFPDEHYDGFIAASTVKFLESGGARVVPVWIGQNKSYYKKVVKYTNGILFPGGATYFNETNGYGDAATKIYKIAKDVNDAGGYFPIYGFCLGMQVFVYAEVGKDFRENCFLKKVAVPLTLEKNYKDSKLFSNISQEILDILQSQNVTYNYHQYCLTKSGLKESGVLDQWNILSTNKDELGLEFVSTMEHKKYPFFGLQYHPEKPRFEFKKTLNIPHNLNTVKVSQYFASVFVEQSKKNDGSFPDDTILDNALIYNFNPFFTANRSSYNQLYMFKKSDFDNNQL